MGRRLAGMQPRRSDDHAISTPLLVSDFFITGLPTKMHSQNDDWYRYLDAFCALCLLPIHCSRMKMLGF